MVSMKSQILNTALDQAEHGVTVKEFAAYGFQDRIVRDQFRHLAQQRHLVFSGYYRNSSPVYILPVFQGSC